MKERKLISMVKMVQESMIDRDKRIIDDWKYLCITIGYANLLSQNLADRYEINGVSAHPLNRFVPCDLEGNVLEEPKDASKYLHGIEYNLTEQKKEYAKQLEEYQKATDRVLFEGFSWRKTIEDHAILLSYKDRKFTGGITKDGFQSLGNKVAKTIEDLINYKFYEPYEGITLTKSAIKLIEG